MDYGLARRATFAAVLAGRTTVTDACDAHPYLPRPPSARRADRRHLPDMPDRTLSLSGYSCADVTRLVHELPVVEPPEAVSPQPAGCW